MHLKKTVKCSVAELQAIMKVAAKDDPEWSGAYVVAAYRHVLAKAGLDWDRIAKLDGWPRVNPEEHKKLMQTAMDLDKEYQDRTGKRTFMVGGAWMNSGFGSADGIPNGSIRLDFNVELAS